MSSEQGVGSSLKVYISAEERTGMHKIFRADTGPSPSEEVAGVLLVDDEKNMLYIGQYILNKAGYTVFIADHAKEAIEVYKRNKDAIQCIILDLSMPVMDGVECLKELIKLDPSVKVVLSSGYNREDVESRIHSDDIAGFLKKPYGLKALLAVVERVIAR